MKKYFSSCGQSINQEQIENFIEENNINLPHEYIKFLSELNGGTLKKQLFDLRPFDFNRTNPNTYIIIDEFLNFYQLGKAWSYTEGILKKYDLFPIADVRGGMILCCKQNNNERAELYFYDNDFGIIQLTNSLVAFFNLLVSEENTND